MKGSAVVETMTPLPSRSTPALRPDPGPSTRPIRRPDRDRRVSGQEDRFDRSITDFSERYADQNEQDYEAFAKAVRSGGWRRSRASDGEKLQEAMARVCRRTLKRDRQAAAS